MRIGPAHPSGPRWRSSRRPLANGSQPGGLPQDKAGRVPAGPLPIQSAQMAHLGDALAGCTTPPGSTRRPVMTRYYLNGLSATGLRSSTAADASAASRIFRPDSCHGPYSVGSIVS